MTISLTASRRLALLAAVVAVGVAPMGTIGAQGGPPAARAPLDTQPALRVPASASRPPSAVAPRTRSVRQLGPATADTSLKLIKRVSAPVDSVRPAPATVSALDPSRAPRVQAPPPAPGTAATARVTAPRALLTSDTPPAGATARCKDGTFLTTTLLDDNSCSDHGGIAVRLPQRQPPPPRPRP